MEPHPKLDMRHIQYQGETLPLPPHPNLQFANHDNNREKIEVYCDEPPEEAYVVVVKF